VIYRKAFLISIFTTNCWFRSQHVLGADQAIDIIQEQTHEPAEGLKGLDETLIYLTEFIDHESLKSLTDTNSIFCDLGKEPQVQHVLKKGELRRLLSRVRRLEPDQLYKAVLIKEIRAAAKGNQEPGYLATIQEAYGLRVGAFVGGLTIGESRDARIRHGVKIMCLMHTIWDTAWGASSEVAWDDASSDPAGAAAREISLNAARDASMGAALNAAKNASRNAVRSATGTWSSNSYAASHAVGQAIRDTSRSAVKNVLAMTRSLSPQEEARLGYRTAELTALLYVLKFALDDPSKGFQGIFSRIYQASDDICLPQDLSIWESKEAWDAFYAQHFGHLTPDALAFLTPFLGEIEKTRLTLNPQP
jgi:hypothetical protein